VQYCLEQMNRITTFGIVAIIATLVIGTTHMTAPASAQGECQGQQGFERGDCQVHEATPQGQVGSFQDFRFHEGTCQGGHSTQALEEATGGAGCSVLGPPGAFASGR
jgi:hypothetical protein